MAEILKKIQLEDRNGVPIIPNTKAWSVFFQNQEDVYNKVSDMSGSTISSLQTEGSPVVFESVDGASRTAMIPVMQGNIYLVSSDEPCQNFYKLFADANGNAIVKAKNGIPYTSQSGYSVLEAPDNAHFLVVNTKYDGVECNNLKVLHVENLQHKLEKTDVENMSEEKDSDLSALVTLETESLENIRSVGGVYTTQINHLKDEADKLDAEEYPLDFNYTITPDFEELPYTNYIAAEVVEYGTQYPSLRRMYIDKIYNGITTRIYDSYSTAAVIELESEIEYGKEEFLFHAEKQDSVKEVTETAKRYLCFIGTSSESTANSNVATGLTKYLVDNVNMELEISTGNGEYIWFIIPEELFINNVRSSGFNVTLNGEPTQIDVLEYGSYNAYRTLNPLGAATWKLVVRQNIK